jgi:ABC-type transport system involved in cytochrome c biogenesis permease subunit
MEIVRIFSNMGPAALLSILVSLLPMLAGANYLFRPSEQRLALMRPLSLAGIFAGLGGACLGAINTLRGLWLEPPRDGRILAIASAESIVPLYVAFSCLMIAWLCVAGGMRRGQ